MNKIALLVVVYNKELRQSVTLTSLLRFTYRLERLVVVNNGPRDIDVHDELLAALNVKHANVQLFNYKENRPLSKIYNDFLHQAQGVDYYVLFDDDTDINFEFEKYIFDLQSVDLELPKVISVVNGKQYYPIFNGLVFEQYGFIDNTKGDIYSIGSGLVISSQLKKQFNIRGVELFDSHFALYGVDFSFFRKLKLFFKSQQLIISSNVLLNHGLSSSESGISPWRNRERMYDEVLTIKYYSRYKMFYLMKFILKKIFKFEIRTAIEATRVYFVGKHPRC